MVLEANPNQPTQPVTIIPSRSGTSPIGTSSPNSGSLANTNSSYADGAFTTGVNEPSGIAYTVQNTDYGGYIVFDSSASITVTLNQAVGTNFTTTIVNIGTGAITLTPNGGLLVNGSSSLTLASGQGVQVFFANRAWQAYAGTTVIQIVPATTSPVAGVYLTGYSAATGLFSVSTPAGISGTITTAKLTAGGTNGSMTFTNGLLTAQTPAT